MAAFSRRRFISLMAYGASIPLLAPYMCFSKDGDALPNVLFIAIDDLRAELGCYGHPMVQSPNIDRLAAQGARFDRTYCQQALCAPSRVSLLSGYRPDSTGVYNITVPLREVMPEVLTLPQHFKENGYATISLGKIYHFGKDDMVGWTERPYTSNSCGKSLWYDPETRAYFRRRLAEADSLGLESYHQFNYAAGPSTESADVPDDAYADGVIANEAIKMLRKYRNELFFLAAGFLKPHLPFAAPQKYWDLYVQREHQEAAAGPGHRYTQCHGHLD